MVAWFSLCILTLLCVALPMTLIDMHFIFAECQEPAQLRVTASFTDEIGQPSLDVIEAARWSHPGSGQRGQRVMVAAFKAEIGSANS